MSRYYVEGTFEGYIEADSADDSLLVSGLLTSGIAKSMGKSRRTRYGEE